MACVCDSITYVGRFLSAKNSSCNRGCMSLRTDGHLRSTCHENAFMLFTDASLCHIRHIACRRTGQPRLANCAGICGRLGGWSGALPPSGLQGDRGGRVEGRRFGRQTHERIARRRSHLAGRARKRHVYRKHTRESVKGDYSLESVGMELASTGQTCNL